MAQINIIRFPFLQSSTNSRRMRTNHSRRNFNVLMAKKNGLRQANKVGVQLNNR